MTYTQTLTGPRKALLVLLATLVALILSVGPAFADDNVRATTYIAKNDVNISAIVTEANRSLKNSPEIMAYDAKEGSVSFDFTTYNKLDNKDKQTFMQAALSATSKSGLGGQRKSKLYSFISQQDGKVSAAVSNLTTDASANFYSAMALLKPFTGPFSTFLGVVAILIIVFVTTSLFIDLAFIAIPVFQVGDADKGITRRFISSAARQAVREEMDSNKSALWIWFKRRVFVMGGLAIALIYLINGSMYEIMGWFLQVAGVN